MMNSLEEHNIFVRPMLEETFYILSKKNTVYRVKLTEKGLCLLKESNSNIKTETIELSDIVGCRCMRSKRHTDNSCACHPSTTRKSGPRVVDENSLDKDENDISAYLYIYAYVLKNCKVKSGQKREKMTITLRFRSFDKYDDNMKEAQKWKTTLTYLIKTHLYPSYSLRATELLATGVPTEDNRILVILNPKSGPGKARDIFQSRVVPVLTEANVNYELYVTRASNDARCLVRTQDMYQYGGGVVVLGGDGILFEVINGLLERLDWEAVLKRTKLGVVPCGSGNGLAKAISYAYNEPHDQNPVLISTLNIVRGVSTPMDLVRVETSSQVVYSFLSIGWGLLSDIDIESERLRAIGSQRFTVWSVARLIGLRTYRGQLSYCRLNVGQGGESGGIRMISRSVSECFDQSYSPLQSPQLVPSHSFTDAISLETVQAGETGRRDSFYSVASRRSTYLSVASSSYQSLFDDGKAKMYGPASRLPPLSQPPPSNWELQQGEFVMVHAAYQSHLATDCLFAPESKLSDGIIWLSVIRAGISRGQLLQYLVGLSTGAHVRVPMTELIPVSAFRLEPEGSGVLTVDGEKINHGPLQAELLPGIANIMARVH